MRESLRRELGGGGWRCIVLAFCTAAFACNAPEPRPPDVLLITLDTTRADHLGVYGYGRDTSPNLDRFAHDAVTYQRAWASGAWTLPTHASMLTGKQITSHGARFNLLTPDVALSEIFEGDFFTKHKANRLAEDEVTLAELLVQKGYATAAFAGGPWLAPPFGLMQGYALADSNVASPKGRSAEELTNNLIAWMSSIPTDQPLHALINYFDPHSPYDPPPGFDEFPGAKVPLDPGQDGLFINGGKKLSDAQRTAVVDRYDGEIQYMDHHIGRLLGALRDNGRYENALIIVVGDHGELFGEHGVMGHGRWLYEEVIRVPLIIRHPGGKMSGTSVASPVSQVDLLPLIASELSFQLPDGIDGLPVGARDVVLAEAFRDPFSVTTYKNRYDRDLASLIRWPWKLIASDTGEREIFDLETDPRERGAQRGSDQLSAMETAIAKAIGALVPRVGNEPPSDVSPEIVENLRKLGYID
jgi:arylsulfatase A-like enzyme